MSNDEPRDEESDRELGIWLRLWAPPRPPAGLDERVMAAYRSAQAPRRRRGLWEVQVRLSLPVAALLAALLLGAGAAAASGWRRPKSPGDTGGVPLASMSGGLADLRPIPEIRMTVVRRGGSDDQH
jgi:hypothetical protein